MKQLEKNQNSALYNTVVKEAYFVILKKAKQLLATIEHEELRFTLERNDKSVPDFGTIVHEIVNPVLYLRLECHTDSIMAIHFGIEQINQLGQLSEITSKFLRILYERTSKALTSIDIENCVRTDWFINSCSAMYEYIELRNKYHSFKQIKFSPTKRKKKQILSVA